MTVKPTTVPLTVPPLPTDTPPEPATLGGLPLGSSDKVGDYKVLCLLGSGGMGVVYKAFDQKLGRVVALKMLQAGVDAGPEEMVRFRGEAETLGTLQHAH